MDAIEITCNEWKVPTLNNAFDNILEGVPSPSQRAAILAETIIGRAAWKPTTEAWFLLEKLLLFVGCRVRIQLWDSIMFILPNEGPYPVKADLVGIVMLDVDGYQLPHLKLASVTEQVTDDGYSPMSYMRHVEDDQYLAAIGDVYTVTKLNGGCYVST